jgi:hypothetical protein
LANWSFRPFSREALASALAKALAAGSRPNGPLMIFFLLNLCDATVAVRELFR